MHAIEKLGRRVTACQACPRLRDYCESVAKIKRRAYLDQKYWGKPIRGFGDPRAGLFVVGLAPAAHGANRTGRIFTGDRSGDWLYRAMHKAGFANQPTSVSADDGLELRGAYVSCVARCAPPDNKPLPEEIARCTPYLVEELRLLRDARVYLALGGIALNGVWGLLAPGRPRPKFAHGLQVPLDAAPDGRARWLLASYHPSQQNTFTGRLTEPMFDSVFAQAARLLR
jgi:uracil-DNA glycosylase family 4